MTDSPPSPQILVVEDDDLGQKVAGHLLRKYGFSTVVVPDAEAASELFQRKRFRIVLVDISINGFETIKRMKAGKPGNKLRTFFVAITDSLSRDREVASLEDGFDSFIAKPYRPHELIHAVTALLHRAAAN